MHLFMMNLQPLSIEESLFDMPLSERLQAEPLGSDLPGPNQCSLIDSVGLPVLCRICGLSNRWVQEGPVFVCAHEPLEETPWLPRIDSIRAERVRVRP
jgi:hypothetical protein